MVHRTVVFVAQWLPRTPRSAPRHVVDVVVGIASGLDSVRIVVFLGAAATAAVTAPTPTTRAHLHESAQGSHLRVHPWRPAVIREPRAGLGDIGSGPGIRVSARGDKANISHNAHISQTHN